MSLNQAFRELSWKFHGRKPSHWQQLKFQKQIEKQKGKVSEQEMVGILKEPEAAAAGSATAARSPARSTCSSRFPPVSQ